VVAYSVAQRTGEFGIRMALGATSRHLLRIVLGQGIVMTTMGLAVGLLVTVALSRSVESLLYGVRPFDPLTVTSVAGVLGLVALAASVLPARRALRIDPSTAIRAE
jgi:ABC-type antimicrobial peptide transport system permease subunit